MQYLSLCQSIKVLLIPQNSLCPKSRFVSAMSAGEPRKCHFELTCPREYFLLLICFCLTKFCPPLLVLTFCRFTQCGFRSFHCLYPQMVISKITVFAPPPKMSRRGRLSGARRATSSAALGKCAVSGWFLQFVCHFFYQLLFEFLFYFRRFLL